MTIKFILSQEQQEDLLATNSEEFMKSFFEQELERAAGEYVKQSLEEVFNPVSKDEPVGFLDASNQKG